MLFRRLLLVVSVLCTVAISPVFAADIHISPFQALSTDQYLALAHMKYSAQGNVDGTGAFLRLSYSSSNELQGYVAIMNDDGAYSPADMYSFTLPADTNGVATVDLSVLTTWTPSFHHYFLSFLSNNPKTDAQFTDMAILPGTFFGTIGAALHHLWAVEPFWVSTMHMLSGYKIMGTSFSLLLGCLMLCAVLLALLWKRSAGISLAFLIVSIGCLLYAARFGVDLSRMTVSQLQEWMMEHSYAQAGDTYSVADAILKEATTTKEPTAVSVCFDSTDYYAKLIRYLVYPIPVTMSGTILPQTTLVVVTRSLDYKEDGDILHCGGIDHAVKKLQTFADGTVLYSVPRS